MSGRPTSRRMQARIGAFSCSSATRRNRRTGLCGSTTKLWQNGHHRLELAERSGDGIRHELVRIAGLLQFAPRPSPSPFRPGRSPGRRSGASVRGCRRAWLAQEGFRLDRRALAGAVAGRGGADAGTRGAARHDERPGTRPNPVLRLRIGCRREPFAMGRTSRWHTHNLTTFTAGHPTAIMVT